MLMPAFVHVRVTGILLNHSSSIYASLPADTLVEPDVSVSLTLANSFHLLLRIRVLCKGPEDLSAVSSVQVAWGREVQRGCS